MITDRISGNITNVVDSRKTCHRRVSKFNRGDRELYLFTKICSIFQKSHKYLKSCTFLTMQEAVTQDKDLLKIITTKSNSTASCNQHNRT